MPIILGVETLTLPDGTEVDVKIGLGLSIEGIRPPSSPGQSCATAVQVEQSEPYLFTTGSPFWITSISVSGSEHAVVVSTLLASVGWTLTIYQGDNCSGLVEVTSGSGTGNGDVHFDGPTDTRFYAMFVPDSAWAGELTFSDP
jgi:hypothetical protein